MIVHVFSSIAGFNFLSTYAVGQSYTLPQQKNLAVQSLSLLQILMNLRRLCILGTQRLSDYRLP